jgi:hypothetical protein
MENKPKEELATDEQIDAAAKEWVDSMKDINKLKKIDETTKVKMIAARDRYKRANETIRNFKIDSLPNFKN